MENTAKLPQKKRLLHPMLFLTYWFFSYFAISLLGDFVVTSFMLPRIEGTTSQLLNNYELIIVTFSCFILFYGAQQILVQMLFQVRIRYWITASLLGWLLGICIALIIDSILNVQNVYYYALPTNFRLASTMIFTIALIQWWLMHDKIHKAWIWVAGHLVAILTSAIIAGESHAYILILYSGAYDRFSFDIIWIKLLLLNYSLITGITAVLIKRHNLRKSKRKLDV